MQRMHGSWRRVPGRWQRSHVSLLLQEMGSSVCWLGLKDARDDDVLGKSLVDKHIVCHLGFLMSHGIAAREGLGYATHAQSRRVARTGTSLQRHFDFTSKRQAKQQHVIFVFDLAFHTPRCTIVIPRIE